jgi:D-alanyl-lipoteichoic acid acyltransferase DltB (MBOAT superfamily)
VQWIILLGASLVLYAYYSPTFLAILIAVVIASYLTGLNLQKEQSDTARRVILITGIAIVVGVLVFFRYPLIIGNIFSGLHSDDPDLFRQIILPIGLSFQVFQGISYMTDVYWRVYPPENHFGKFSLYMLFFPKILNGPIQRAEELLPQLQSIRVFHSTNLKKGGILILWGLFKKLVIADNLDIVVDGVYSTPGHYTGLPVIIGIIFFTFQLYCDFSGYADIALGSAQIFGIDLTDNFNFPFRSRSVAEFWRRWHISLSNWFNDYVFNPLVVQIRDLGNASIYISLFVTFLITGIWHGPKTTWLIYGILQALAVSYEVYTARTRKKISKRINPKFMNVLSVVLTFSFISFSWIFMRSSDLDQAMNIIRNAIDFSSSAGLSLPAPQSLVVGCSLLVVTLLSVEHFMKGQKIDQFIQSQRKIVAIPFLFLTLAGVILLGTRQVQPFIYFQF